MEKRVLKTFEYDKILTMLKERASCCISRELVDTMEPSGDFDTVERELKLTAEAETLFYKTGRSPVDDFPDMRHCLERMHAALFLSTGELLGIASCLKAARIAKDILAKEVGEESYLYNLAGLLITHRSAEEEINRCIINEDEIFDGASPALARIRRAMRLANEKVREKLNSMIRSTAYQKYLQEPIITIRNGRFVIPVKQEYRQQVPGLIHDQSSSGATLFIEPSAVVELGNEYKKLLAEEADEIERILTELTAMLAPYADEIREDLNIMGQIDLVFAKAKLSRELNAVMPRLNRNNYVRIVRGRHPLIPADRVVPIDIWIGRDYRSLIITGPNTGGKTVTLKTIGLLSAMTQCGLHIPCADGSTMPVFDEIMADIGDEQSIEQSLSTFSAHMTNTVRMLQACDERSLLLFDELGAGTDPTEGAALAIAIIEHARRCGALIAATTHYTELKVYATTQPGVMNASCEFDVDSLRPTYHLLIGIPGKSNAFAISERLGLPEEIISDARSRVSTESASMEATIEKLEQVRQLMERDRAEAARQLRAAEEDRRKAERMKAELSVRLEKADEKARRDAERIIGDARRTADEVMRELDALRKQQKKLDAQQMNAQRAEIMHNIKEARDAVGLRDERAEPIPKPSRPIREGDLVEIPGTRRQAEVTAVKGDTLTLKAGPLQMKVKADEVRLIEEAERAATAKKQPQFAPSQRILRTASAARELDIRGMETLEAESVLDNYIDAAVMAHLETVTIIHGKGTGALRKAVHASLRRNKAVKSFRLGNYGEGESGVTVVELK